MSCDKVPFDTIDEARRRVKSIEQKQGSKMQPYTCEKWGNIHLATKGKAKRRFKSKAMHMNEDADMANPSMKEGKWKIKEAKQKGVAIIRSFCVSNQNK